MSNSGPAPGVRSAAASRRRRVAVLLVACAGLGAPVGWAVSDRLEQDNDFCTACHLEPGVPLHIDIRRDFDAEPPTSLVSLHGGGRVEGRADAGFRCIDCHGGTGALGRARVKALAALDGFWYAMRRFEEPTEMAWPLWDEDCQKCHAQFDATPSQEWQTPRFHELSVHNVDLGVDCVECHRGHDSSGSPEAFFLRASWVATQCARCHPEFEEGIQ